MCSLSLVVIHPRGRNSALEEEERHLNQLWSLTRWEVPVEGLGVCIAEPQFVEIIRVAIKGKHLVKVALR
jgi:hypothetical protein